MHAKTGSSNGFRIVPSSVQCFAGFHQERHAVPPRVVDEESRGREGRGDAPLGHRRVVDVGGVRFPAFRVALVLPYHNIVQLQLPHRSQHFHLNKKARAFRGSVSVHR